MSAPLIIPSSSTATGVTLARHRRLLAEALGTWQQTTVTALATGGEAARVILADELRDDEAGHDPGAAWLYAATGGTTGEQRRILSQREAGYQGARGGVVTSRPFAAAVPASTPIEVTSPLPVKDHLGVQGLNRFVNMALARIRVEVRLALTGNGTSSHDLGALAPWLTRYEQTAGIYDTAYAPGGAAPALSTYGYRIVGNGASRTLVTDWSYTSAETFYLAAWVHADRYVSDGTAWAYATTPGLQHDAYQSAAPEHWVTAYGCVYALRHLMRLALADRTMDTQERAERLAMLADERRRWSLAARQIQLHEMPRSVPERSSGIISVGYGIGGWS